MTEIGDVYRSSKDSDLQYVLQLVARDITQLNSDVIAIWKIPADEWNSYSYADLPKPDIFLHTTVLAGVRLSLWEQIGSSQVPDFSKVRFKYDAQDDLDVINPDERKKQSLACLEGKQRLANCQKSFV